MSDTESPSFIRENSASQDPEVKDVDCNKSSELDKTHDGEAMIPKNMEDVPQMFAPDETDSPEPVSSPTKDSEIEETLEDQIRLLRKSLKQLEKECKSIRSALTPVWQTPFQNGAKNITIGTSVCRSCLYRCEYGGIYMNLSLEDVDAFLASEAAEVARKPDVYTKECAMELKKDWLNTIALGDIEVDCRWTGQGRRDLRISNGEKSYHIAALCSEGFLLGRSGMSIPATASSSEFAWLPSLLEFRPFNRLTFSPWTFEFPEHESLAVCECSSSDTQGLIAAVTHSNVLRIFGIGGNLLYTEILPPVVCVTALSDILAVLMQVSPATVGRHHEQSYPSPLKHEGRQLTVNLAETATENYNVYRVALYRVDSSLKCPVERVDVSPELYTQSQIRWFGLTSDSTHLPVIITFDYEALCMGYSATQSGYISRQMSNETVNVSDDYFALHAEKASQENEDIQTERTISTRFTDSRRCKSYVAAWMPVAQNLDSLKVKDFTVHSCTTKYLDILPACTTFVCHPLTRVYFQMPLCLPPSLIALKTKYPIDLSNIIAFNSLTKEEKQSRGFNPLTSHFLDEQTVRLRSNIILPLLRNAAWRPADLSYSGPLVEEFFEAKSALEVAATQNAILAIHDSNFASFAQSITQVNNQKAIALIHKHMSNNNNGELVKAWTKRFSEGKTLIDETEEERENLDAVVVRNVKGKLENIESGKEMHSGEHSVKPDRTAPLKTDLASLITGSIDLRNNMKKRRLDF